MSDVYTIAVRTRSDGRVSDSVFARFPTSAVGLFWDELNVGSQRWEEWRSTINSIGQSIPVLPDFPEISNLAYIDEGVIAFSSRRLHDDCARMLPAMANEATRQLIGQLLDASILALSEENAEVIVHPFG
jgi:hypothetical protein